MNTFDYAEHVGETCPQYGGTITDISKLDYGTQFYVNNGGWSGKIVHYFGHKGIETPKGVFTMTGPYFLAISDLKIPDIEILHEEVTVVVNEDLTFKVKFDLRMDQTLSKEQQETEEMEQVNKFIEENIKYFDHFTFESQIEE